MSRSSVTVELIHNGLLKVADGGKEKMVGIEVARALRGLLDHFAAQTGVELDLELVCLQTLVAARS